MHKPMINEITGFDAAGSIVGSARYAISGLVSTPLGEGWIVTRRGDHYEFAHEHQAREKLREWGAVDLKESDGRKY